MKGKTKSVEDLRSVYHKSRQSERKTSKRVANQLHRDGLRCQTLHITHHLVCNWCSQTSDRIPALCTLVTFARRKATVFSALVVANCDISEGIRLLSIHFVQQGVEE